MYSLILPKKIPSGLYVHVGCDKVKLKDFINVDFRETSATDIVSKCWSINGIENSTVAFIYSRHTIEHISLHDAKKTFLHWFDLLVPGGIINIIVPDIEFHAKQILGMEKSNIPNLSDQMLHASLSIWGWQIKERGGTRGDNHLWGYTFQTLKEELLKSGFVNIERFLLGQDNQAWHLNVIAKKP